MVLKEACYKAGEFMFWLSCRVEVCTDYDRNVSRVHCVGTGPHDGLTTTTFLPCVSRGSQLLTQACVLLLIKTL